MLAGSCLTGAAPTVIATFVSYKTKEYISNGLLEEIGLLHLAQCRYSDRKSGSNPGPFCCALTVETTEPPCCLSMPKITN